MCSAAFDAFAVAPAHTMERAISRSTRAPSPITTKGPTAIAPLTVAPAQIRTGSTIVARGSIVAVGSMPRSGAGGVAERHV
jgi:hypothetical protein